MNRHPWSILLIPLVFCGMVSVNSSGHAAQAGFAERDITPDIGMERPGGYHKAYHRAIHDPCKVRAGVFDDGLRRVAVVGVDALVVPRALVERCRQRIETDCGISASHVMIAASHSHSSGPVGIVQPGEYDHASSFVQKLAYQESSTADPKYLATVEEAIVEAVCEANLSRKTARFGFGKGIEDQVAFNRRFHMKNGLTFTHPGQGNPDIVEPAGPTDPEVGVIAAWDEDDQLLGCIVNFACHATTSPPGASANYIYYLEKTIRGSARKEAIVVFTAGASGDVTQVDNLSPYQRPSGEESARFVGTRVGAEVVKVLVSITKTDSLTVAAKSKTIHIPRRKPSDEHVERARKLLEDPPENADTTELTFAKETVMLAAKIEHEPVVDVEIQAIQLGPAVLIGNPAEYFCQFGLDIKDKSTFPLTFPVSFANGFIGYVPTEDAFGPHGGGYETRLTSYSNLIPEAGRMIAEESIALIKTLKPVPLPQPPPHPPFRGKGWSYGNVPPQVD